MRKKKEKSKVLRFMVLDSGDYLCDGPFETLKKATEQAKKLAADEDREEYKVVKLLSLVKATREVTVTKI